VGIINGTAPSTNDDDGNLNYDKWDGFGADTRHSRARFRWRNSRCSRGVGTSTDPVIKSTPDAADAARRRCLEGAPGSASSRSTPTTADFKVAKCH
jgi:hypothetical protein